MLTVFAKVDNDVYFKFACFIIFLSVKMYDGLLSAIFLPLESTTALSQYYRVNCIS